jgi:hypothetical protein
MKIPKPQKENQASDEAKFRPSALPMLRQCPKFEGATSEYAYAGTERHQKFADYWRGLDNALDDLDEDSQENMEWAVDYVTTHAANRDYTLEIEQKRSAVLPDGRKIEGTPDLVCGPDIFDLKWRFRDYGPQMAAYAYMVLDEGKFPEVTTHILFANNQVARSRKWTVDLCWAVMHDIITNAESEWAAPTPCEYCGWCAKKLRCEALIQQVNIALASNPEWDLEQWHSSEITNAKQMGQALKIARTLSDWCESVEFHAKELATKQGIIADGFTLLSRSGKRFITDISGAFQATGLPQPEFLKACIINPKPLEEIYAKFHGMKKAPAARDLAVRLGPLIQRKPSVNMLVADKPSKKKE